MRTLPRVLAALALLLSAPALAQGGGAMTVDLTLSPAEVHVMPDDASGTRVNLLSYRDAPVEVEVAWELPPESADVATNVELERTRVRLEPGVWENFTLTFDVPADAPRGRQHAYVVLREPGEMEKLIVFWIVVGEDDVPPPDVPGAPVVEPAALRAEAPVNERAEVVFLVRNPDARSRNYSLASNVSGDWRIELPMASGVGPGETWNATFRATPGAEAPDRTEAQVWVLVEGSVAKILSLELIVDRQTTSTRFDVEPYRVEVPLGGAATARLIGGMTLGREADVQLRLDAPDHPGVVAEWPEGHLRLAPQYDVALEFVLRDTRGVPLEGYAHVEVVLPGGAVHRHPFYIAVVPVEDGNAPAATHERAPIPLVPAVGAASLAAVGAGALGVAATNRRAPLLLTTLYARIRPSRMLDSRMRRAMLDAVRAEPGLRVADLQRRVGLANGQVAHHLRQLVGARLVVAMRDGTQRRVYPADARPADAASAAPDLAARALACLRREGRMPLADLARDLGVTRQTMHREMRRLHDEGRVTARLEGGRVWLAAQD